MYIKSILLRVSVCTSQLIGTREIEEEKYHRYVPYVEFICTLTFVYYVVSRLSKRIFNKKIFCIIHYVGLYHYCIMFVSVRSYGTWINEWCTSIFHQKSHVLAKNFISIFRGKVSYGTIPYLVLLFWRSYWKNICTVQH